MVDVPEAAAEEEVTAVAAVDPEPVLAGGEGVRVTVTGGTAVPKLKCSKTGNSS